MIQFAIDAFVSAGLLARQVVKFGTTEKLDQIRIGETDWSCKIALACEELAAGEQISTKHIWVVIQEGRSQNQTFRLDTLLQDGLIGVWQILGGRDSVLRNNSLDHLRRYTDIDGIDPVVLQDIDDSLEGVLQGFGYNHTWNANGTPAEESGWDNSGWSDSVVFEYSDDENTQPHVMIKEISPRNSRSAYSQQMV